jgi:hypothetical protein
MLAGDLGDAGATSNARRTESRDGARRTTVSGRTITSTSAQCAQTDESQTQKTLSAPLSWRRFGLGTAENRELLAEGKVLQGQLPTGAKQRT